jgi:hypothetical protein
MPFDLRVHSRDPKSGQVIASNPYKLQIKDGKALFERPLNSGMFYDISDKLDTEASASALAKVSAAEAAKVAASKPAHPVARNVSSIDAKKE